jgi:hypothetical protein
LTEVYGLRLAYRGFVTGIAAAYVWLAVAMATSGLLAHDPLAPLRPLASALIPGAGNAPELAFVLGFALAQLGGAVAGMVFAYFFGRFFTVRLTLAGAAACFGLLAWGLLAAGIGHLGGQADLGLRFAPLVASLTYGLLLGAGVPLRGEVLRPAA